MPTNVTVEYLKAEKKYMDAKLPIDKINALQEMLSTVPKHKGTENLRAEITRKIKKLTEKIAEQEKKEKKGKAKYSIKKEGAAQLIVLGLTNSGKSHLINKLTNAEIKEAFYPFTTVKPEQAMLSYKKALIQLVELPAVIQGYSEGKFEGKTFLSYARNADALIIVLSNKKILEEFNLIKNELLKAKIHLNKEKPKIKIQKTGFKGINV